MRHALEHSRFAADSMRPPKSSPDVREARS